MSRTTGVCNSWVCYAFVTFVLTLRHISSLTDSQLTSTKNATITTMRNRTRGVASRVEAEQSHGVAYVGLAIAVMAICFASGTIVVSFLFYRRSYLHNVMRQHSSDVSSRSHRRLRWFDT
ncbi:uncharacterized protein LOC121386777 [Gigantopelta aegis]|uniref:uncharacterized protein LOC121386777 n=1 Tax=Gigantopelta aegis TaxID=1735272 RepID=UPI001B88897B|nr:uncharacterized protein LOC121386777 [Gigantopelta aegis]